MNNEKRTELRRRMGELADVKAVVELLQWDQEVMMPPRGAEARGAQLATLSTLEHRLQTDGALGELLHALHGDTNLTDDDRALVSEGLYDFRRAVKLPEDFVHRFARATSEAYEVWVKARAESDFGCFQPKLEGLLDLLREKAELLGYEDSPYDALLEDFERGMTTAQLRDLFGRLAPQQSQLVERIAAAPRQPDTTWLDQDWSVDRQWDITMRIVRDLGFDLEAGRQDRSVHPFTTSFDTRDVRLTTRLAPDKLFEALTSSIHECGHGLYEQGFLDQDRRTVLADSPSLGMHESQSRLWENMVGRSRAFCAHYHALLTDTFPGRLDGISREDVYRVINHVSPGLIRVEADECTYNLHIILRFELEVDLLEGRLAVADVPGAWNSKVKEYLGLDVPDDARGCLQDIHWAHGCMGYFPTYALGNLYAAQLFDAIRADLPDLDSDIAQGRFAPLLEWLRTHVHHVGRRMTAPAIVERATGYTPTEQPFLDYLNRKYTELYGLC